MTPHINSGDCAHCNAIFDKYSGFHVGLRQWFKSFQKKTPDAHISCAGRGAIEQEACFQKGTSKAHYGQSAHNYNCAIDLFRLTINGASWDLPWFRNVVQTAVCNQNVDPNKQFDLKWYGMLGSPYFELPHVEVANWKDLVRWGEAKIVEPLSASPNEHEECHNSGQ